MQCPIDSTPLIQDSSGIENLHRCDECKGTFIGGNIFSEIHAFSAMENHKRANGSGSFIQRSDKAELSCPKDGKPMHTVIFKSVEIDVCPTCHSVWFDNGEVEKINAQVAMAKRVNLAKIGEEKPWIGNGVGLGGGVVDGLEGIELVGDIVGFIGSMCD
ncbi:zf-TFIIB domain-containing protein [Undibacterium amnicola]|nr:zf-TFIIB domain-containing protein [Undibacterium amnicola]